MQIIPDEKIAEFSNFIDSHGFFYVIGHKEPDGDAVFSALSMKDLLEKKGKEAQLLSAGPFKRTEIRNMEGLFSNSARVLPGEERKKAALVVLDCSESSRFGEIGGDISGLDTYVIDHHRTSEAGGNSIIDPTSPATACLVQQLYEKIAGEIPAEVAGWLFFGLSTDTGYFRFLNSDSAEVFRQAARLVDAGASPRRTHDEMSGGKAYSTRKLLGLMLARAERKFANRLIVTYETQEDTKRLGQEGRDSDALYSLLLSVEGVEAVLFVRQESDEKCTAGFRSRDKIDVSAIAAKFGGGGHKNAAGLSVEGKLDDVISMICEEFGKAFR